MESISAAIFTIILLLPLVLQVHLLLLNPKKLGMIFHYYATNVDDNTTKPPPKLLQHYFKEAPAADIESDSKIALTNLRTVSSSPVISRLPTNIKPIKRPNASLLLAVKHSCTFVKTDQELPVVDIGWNYTSYRYKTFEQCLKDLYGDNYPPGEVLLNSMQLNLLDSRTNLSGMDLFDFVKDSEPTANETVSKKPEFEYLNPLDHFVNKLPSRPCTEDRFTETLHGLTCQDQLGSSDDIVSRQEPIRGVINGREKNRRSCRKIEPCKCNLSVSIGPVYASDDFEMGRKHPDRYLRGPGLVENGSIWGRV